MKNYDHLTFSRASVVQFWASRYVIGLNLTSESKVMAIWIFLVHPCLISSISIYYAPESDIRVKSYDHFNFSWASVFHSSVSIYYWFGSDIRVKCCCHLNLPCASIFDFGHLDILCAWIGHPSEKLWPFEFLENFRCSISRVSIYYFPESDIRVKSYDHLNLSRSSVVHFRASRYLISRNRTSVWNVMTIWISLELPLINSERLDMWYTWIGHPS